MFSFENLLRAIQLLTRKKMHTLTCIKAIYYIYFLKINKIEKST